jgi:acetolactate synthase-1/2/3 large subunit
MKASDAVAEFLIAHRVQTCFELVGGMITHLLDSFAQSGRFQIISMHHEQAAAFAAEGVARASKGRQIAVAMGTSGPGATNLITGIGSCWFDSVPCLFITGQVNTHELKGGRAVRQQGFQELDIVELVHPITKSAVRVMHADELLPALHRAISLAVQGRMGPVLLDIPNDVQRGEIADEGVAEWISRPLEIVASLPQISASERQAFSALCAEARNPLICIGGGARWADALPDWLEQAERHGIPYVATLMGHERVMSQPHYFNLIGTYGNREANWALQNCDLLIVLGARLDVRQTGANIDDFARNARIVQVDIDPAQLNNRIPVELAIQADVGDFLGDFALDATTFPKLDPAWQRALDTRKLAAMSDEYPDWKISPSRLLEVLQNALHGVGVDYVCDVGNHQMWAAQNLRLQPGQAAHFSGGMGAMGFALPAAIGIAMQTRGKVIVLTGDGSLQINSHELDTLNRLGLDITVIVMNNASLGMVKNFQDMYFNGRDQSTRKGYSYPSFVRLAAAYDIEATRVDDLAGLNVALQGLSARKTPYLIEVSMEYATECRPRLAFGNKLDEQTPQRDA